MQGWPLAPESLSYRVLAGRKAGLLWLRSYTFRKQLFVAIKHFGWVLRLYGPSFNQKSLLTCSTFLQLKKPQKVCFWPLTASDHQNS